jgi:hypothetical protein
MAVAESVVGAARWPAAWAPGVTAQPLAGGVAVELPTGAATIGLGRVMLQPGEALPLAAAGPIVLVVETGVLTLTTHQGVSQRIREGGGAETIVPGVATTLATGEGALVPYGATGDLRNDGTGPVLLDLLSVAAADAWGGGGS